MSVAAAQSAAFFSELAERDEVWTISDSGGVPTSTNHGVTAMPFWSSESRARKVIENVAAYSGFQPRSIPLTEFADRWLPGMAKDGLKIGINWSGSGATGYDLNPDEVKQRLAA